MSALTDLLPDPVPGLGPEVRPEALDEAAVERLLAGVQARAADLLHACLLLWHDRLEAAHALVQRHEGDREADCLHAIMHRREPDEDNSCYWWGRTGEHPVGVALGTEAARLGLASLCRADGCIDAPVMTHACCRGGQPTQALRALQACELRLLAGRLFAP